MKLCILTPAVVVLVSLLAPAPAFAADYSGTLRAGYVYSDEDGNRGVFQPTYNLYEGAALSLKDFYYAFDNGLRLYADLDNVTLNDRTILVGATKARLFGLSVRNSQYRRTYSFTADRFTRRNATRTDGWLQALPWLKLFGGLGYVDKHGTVVKSVAAPPLGLPTYRVDYDHFFYNAGVTVGGNRRFATLEYRGSDFSDGPSLTATDRASRRYRLTAYGPVPGFEKLVLHGGAQRFEHSLTTRDDSLVATTVWGGGRYSFGDGWGVRYNAVWNRARSTDDLASTDNITHAVFGDKRFGTFAGATAGYRYRYNDDIRNERRADGFVVSGWIRPVPALTVRAGYGADMLDTRAGDPLIREDETTRGWASVKYRHPRVTWQAKVEHQSRDRVLDDRSLDEGGGIINVTASDTTIATEVDFVRVASDLTADLPRYGQVSASYAYYHGDYANAGGDCFAFEEHVVSGDLLTAPCRGFRVGVGGQYYRTRLDQDIESFSLRLRGVYEFLKHYAVEAVYAAHNYDDFADLGGLYDQYYTANVVQVSLVYDFGAQR
ncbi:MAG TPA: hypothetical protein PK186_13000 [candidate division Zixibacteria bacterium]|nr:hypothetical protein [candidate division Zixibacteria bacterium]MDD4918642.1 hypothetical protein [candidate division Zixibacteria bacterium]MDM7971744.1 hypothetical protein [candidate division Zixibacteria bacterium]HPM38466.1 hypothetical protein [candidate division Zixibacteria bacterium]HQL23795.1 hypothetical protein [candidate division Zixibacteria bacterium]